MSEFRFPPIKPTSTITFKNRCGNSHTPKTLIAATPEVRFDRKLGSHVQMPECGFRGFGDSRSMRSTNLGQPEVDPSFLIKDLGDSKCPFVQPPKLAPSNVSFSQPHPATSYNGAQWSSALAEAMAWTNTILHNIIYYLNWVSSLVFPWDRAKAWNYNDDFYESETQGYGSPRSWFGPVNSLEAPSFTTLNTVKTVFASMVQPIITGTPKIIFSNNWTTNSSYNASQAFRDKVKNCSVLWGFSRPSVNTMWLCPEWPGLNIYKRWTNIGHELTHYAGRTHQCSTLCFDPDAANPCPQGLGACERGPSCRALVSVGDYQKALKNSMSYTNFVWCFFRAHSEVKCYPLMK